MIRSSLLEPVQMTDQNLWHLVNRYFLHCKPVLLASATVPLISVFQLIFLFKALETLLETAERSCYGLDFVLLNWTLRPFHIFWDMSHIKLFESVEFDLKLVFWLNLKICLIYHFFEILFDRFDGPVLNCKRQFLNILLLIFFQKILFAAILVFALINIVSIIKIFQNNKSNLLCSENWLELIFFHH